MTDGASERRRATLESSPAGNGPAIPEAPPVAPPARGAAPTARTKRAGGRAVAVFKGVANLVFMALVIYLTYFFTMFFSSRPAAPSPAQKAPGSPPRRSRSCGPRSAGS